MTREMIAVICRCSKTKKLFGMRFDKAKGNVYFDVDADGTYDDGIIVFDITPLRGNRTAKVQLVTTTGKHTIGEFE